MTDDILGPFKLRQSNPERFATLSSQEIDRQLTAVSNQYRRTVLIQLKHGEIDCIADLLGHERGSFKRTEQRLFHTHLPKLAEAGYINWDQKTGEIERGDQFHEIIPVLEILETHWHFLRT